MASAPENIGLLCNERETEEVKNVEEEEDSRVENENERRQKLRKSQR